VFAQCVVHRTKRLYSVQDRMYRVGCARHPLVNARLLKMELITVCTTCALCIHTLFCTLHSAHSTLPHYPFLYTVHCTSYTVPCTFYTILSCPVVHAVHCTPHHSTGHSFFLGNSQTAQGDGQTALLESSGCIGEMENRAGGRPILKSRRRHPRLPSPLLLNIHASPTLTSDRLHCLICTAPVEDETKKGKGVFKYRFRSGECDVVCVEMGGHLW
jgi:hypothetical protein